MNQNMGVALEWENRANKHNAKTCFLPLTSSKKPISTSISLNANFGLEINFSRTEIELLLQSTQYFPPVVIQYFELCIIGLFMVMGFPPVTKYFEVGIIDLFIANGCPTVICFLRVW